MQEEIIKKLDVIEEKQDRILSLLSGTNTNMTKLETAEIFFKNCKLEKIPLGRASDLLYPSIYATRDYAIKAIKTLQKKGLLKVQGNFLKIRK